MKNTEGQFPVSIVIDTSFFESNNFLAGKNILLLNKLVGDGIVSIFLTDIIYNEIKSRFKANLGVAKEKVSKPISIVAKDAKILRNFSGFTSYFSFPEIVEQILVEEFNTKLDKWISELKVEIVPTGDLKIQNVFEKYFRSQPPFGSGNKKHEFPDAFTIEALSNFFKKEKRRFYFISLDKDFSNISDCNIYPTKKFEELVDELIRKYSDHKKISETIKFIDELYRINRLDIQNKLNAFLSDRISQEADLVDSINNIDVNLTSVDIQSIHISGFNILELDLEKGKAVLKAGASFLFQVSFEGKDYDSAFYDSEDGRWLNLKEVNFDSGGENKIYVFLILSFEMNKIHLSSFEIESVEFIDDLDIEGRVY